MMTALLQLDQELFHLLNGVWQHPFLDAVIPYWRSKYFWIPFYLLLAVFALSRYRLKGLFFLLAFGLTVGLADFVSSELVKKNVQRIRPCNDTALQAKVHLVIPCGGGYSFTSSHATNHFAMAVFLLFTLGRRYRYLRLPLLLWAASIGYGQIYVGAHYPLDILGGAFLGTLIGFLGAKVYLSRSTIQWKPQ